MTSATQGQLMWIVSPSLVPGIGVDGGDDLTIGWRPEDRAALAAFATDALALSRRLAAQPSNTVALARELKGLADGIGAFAVSSAAMTVAALAREQGDVLPALVRLDRCISEARYVIEMILSRP